MILNCPKCGRPLEDGELLTGDGCMYCSSFSSGVKKQNDKSTDEPVGFVGWVLAILITIGMAILIVRGFLWILGV